MTASRFTEEEITNFDQKAHMFVEKASAWRNWCPYATIPMVRKTEWKVLSKISDAAATLDGSRTNLAASTYTWDEAPLIWFGHHFEWSELEVETARRTGNTISTDEIMLAYRRQANQIERLILQGTMGWEAPDITGLISGSTDAAAGAGDWEDAGGPYAQAKLGYGVLTGLGYEPPFTMLCGENLRAGLAAEHVATGGDSARDVLTSAFEIDNLQFVGIAAAAATPVDLRAYALPAPAADDSRWLMMKADPNNFSVLEVFPPKLTIVPEMDIKRRMFYARLDWMGTLKIVHADSVTDEDSVDLQT